MGASGYFKAIEYYDKAIEKALEMDQFSLIINWGAAWTYWLLSDLEKMHHYAKKLIELEPTFYGGHIILGTNYWVTGEYEAALNELQEAASLNCNPFTLSWLGCFYGSRGEHQKARDILAKLEAVNDHQTGSNYFIEVSHVKKVSI